MNNLSSHNMPLNDKIIMSKWFKEKGITLLTPCIVIMQTILSFKYGLLLKLLVINEYLFKSLFIRHILINLFINTYRIPNNLILFSNIYSLNIEAINNFNYSAEDKINIPRTSANKPMSSPKIKSKK